MFQEKILINNYKIIKDYIVIIPFICLSLYFLFNYYLYTPFQILVTIILTSIFFLSISKIMLSIIIILEKKDSVIKENDLKLNDKLLEELNDVQKEMKNKYI
jgi:magnesium-transporting ATPase (P-type)